MSAQKDWWNELASHHRELFELCIALGLASIGIGLLGGYFHILHKPIPFWLVVGGIALMILALKIDQHLIWVPPPTPPAQPQTPRHIPSHDSHSARWATPQEMHTAWGGKQSNPDEEKVWD